VKCILGRPTYLWADIGFTAILLSSSSIFFVSYPPSSPNGTQLFPATCLGVSAIWKCLSEICVSAPPKNPGPKTHIFRPVRNSTATLTAYIFGTKYNVDNRTSALVPTSDVVHRLKTTWTLVQKRLKIERSIYPPSVNSAF